MKKHFLLILLFLLISCENKRNQNLQYSTTSDVLKLYNQGWIQIMDEGRYGEAETSYRKALENDFDFLVGKSVLARLTLDLEERLLLYEEIQEKKNRITGDERLILDVYSELVNFTNLRDQGDIKAKTAIQKALKLGETNFKKIVHKYPEEIYLKAEYIEFLNSLYGPQQALDSLNKLTGISQKDNPFLLGFAASMHAEIEEYDNAIEMANRLVKVVNDSMQPKTFAVLADVYFQMGNLKIAKKNADRAFELDRKNLDVSRLKKKIDQAIKLRD